MEIDSIIVILIAIALPIITEWRLRRMLKKMMNDPELPKKLAKIIKQVFKEYRNVSREDKDATKVPV